MPLPRVGYCTNVHAGTSLEDVQANLVRVAPSVRRDVCPEAPLGIGLWLPASALDSLGSEGARARFRDWLAEHALVPYTANGFPYGDFHAAIVKHRVYEPDWRTEARVAYTIALAELVSACVPAGSTVPISTLPLGWASAFEARAERDAAARAMHRAVDALAAIEDATGTRIRLALEPEPGCALSRSGDVVRFTEEHLRPILGAERTARYTGVCHDVCHAAVLFEEQAEAMRAYEAGGVEVLKVQVSSAPRVTIPDGEEDAGGIRALARFDEPRYLHQTCVRAPSGARRSMKICRSRSSGRRAPGSGAYTFTSPCTYPWWRASTRRKGTSSAA